MIDGKRTGRIVSLDRRQSGEEGKEGLLFLPPSRASAGITYRDQPRDIASAQTGWSL